MPDPLLECTNEQRLKVAALFMKFTTLGFRAQFTRVETGPVVSTYFFKPLASSILGKVMSKTEDLALSVGAEALLIQRIRDEISIAIPNEHRTIINFDSCLYWLATEPSIREKMLPLLMGCSTSGENFTLDLADQPHILIAGSTGSGKSVFLSQLLTSLAVQKSPDELKLILVDTKQLDLTLFSSLDHVTEMVDNVKDLHGVLALLLKEVRTRTEKMKGIARNIAEWNRMGMGKKFPYFILVIDELADVIAQDKELAKDEDKDSKRTRISASLASLAQISRAAGIHIIAATQRPSVQIISGDIKTNFPTRICFKLPTGTDSRVVLDENGAENLLGKGDYLYKTSQDSTLKRAHGSFVQLDDIAKVIQQHSYIRESFEMMRG